MARYKADIQGNRGGASRLGSANSGIWGHVRGWRLGARVEIDPGVDPDRDEVTIYVTGGSAGFGSYLLATVSETPEGKKFTVNTPSGPISWVI